LENPSAQKPNKAEESEKRQDRQEAIEDDNDDDDFDGEMQMNTFQIILSRSKAENLLPDWCQYNLHPQLLRALYDQKFTTPTPIQSSSIPKAMSKRDVIGIAETVSLNRSTLCLAHYLILGFWKNSCVRASYSSRALD
jgi:ATP-dependent RNA helicase DDX24/MAK5